MARKPAQLTEEQFQWIVKQSKQPPPYLRSLQMAKQLIGHIQATKASPKFPLKRKRFNGAGTA